MVSYEILEKMEKELSLGNGERKRKRKRERERKIEENKGNPKVLYNI